MSVASRSAGQVRSRRALIDLLKQDGPQDAATLAERLSVTAMAVRQHLYQLRDEGLVESRPEPRPVGRPAQLWRLTGAADRLFPDSHAELTVSLLGNLKTALGEAGLERLLAARAEDMAAGYRARLAGKRSLRSRLATLAAQRAEEGYMAAAEQDEDGTWWLLENHCPICAAATACQGLCRIEQRVFQQVLGPGVRVERTEHILEGARRCAYRITPAEGA